MNNIEKTYNHSMNAARCEIGEWHDRHRKEYTKFRAMIDNADNGDYDIYYKIFEMAAEFIPQLVLWQCESLFDGTAKQNIDADEGKAIAKNTFNDVYAELCTLTGYFRIGIETDEIAKQESPQSDDETLFPFANDEKERNKTLLSYLGISNVAEKDETDKQHYYLQIKTSEELWNSLPMLIQYGLPMLLGKSSNVLTECFHRIITAFVMTAPDIYESMLDRIIHDKDNHLLHCVLYYISLDGGLVHSAKHIANLLHSSKGNQILSFIPTIIGNMTSSSIKYGHDKKSDWTDLQNDGDENISKEIRHALSDNKSPRGRRVIAGKTFSLDDMLKGNKELIKAKIREYRKVYPNTTYLSYLLAILVKASCVDKQLPYPQFHRAMEEYEGKKFDMDRASRMYNYMFYHRDIVETSKLPKWATGRMIIKNWQKTFENCC